MTSKLQVPRTRGALSGILLMLLGLWGGLVPFIGPYADFAYTPNQPWTYTSGRLWLEILPAVATIIGGIILTASAHRVIAMLGGWLAALGGAWFVVGGVVSTLWTSGNSSAAGSPVGGHVQQVVTNLAFFSGLGVVIVFLAALALGRLAVVGVRDAALAGRRIGDHEPSPGRDRSSEPDYPGTDTPRRGARPVTPPYAPPAGAGDRSGTAGREPIGSQPRAGYDSEPTVEQGRRPLLPRRQRKQHEPPNASDQKVAGDRTGR